MLQLNVNLSLRSLSCKENHSTHCSHAELRVLKKYWISELVFKTLKKY